MDLPPDPEGMYAPGVLLTGYTRHGFLYMHELINSLTLAFEEKRFLLNEEVMAIILNPDPFLWMPELGQIQDLQMQRDSFFFAILPYQWAAMVQHGGNNAGEDRWPGYAAQGESQEKRMGIKKNRLRNRQHLDRNEVVLDRRDVIGKNRQRRRTGIPRDFEETAGDDILLPNPCPIVLQYRRVPLARRQERALLAFMLDFDEEMLVLLGLGQPQPGLERPPGILPQAPPPGAPVGPGGLLNIGNPPLPHGHGRGHGQGRGRGGLAERNLQLAPQDTGNNSSTSTRSHSAGKSHEEELTSPEIIEDIVVGNPPQPAEGNLHLALEDAGDNSSTSTRTRIGGISHEEELTTQQMIEDIVERLIEDGVLSVASKYSSYTANETIDPETSQNTIRKIIDKMVQDAFFKYSTNRRLGKTVIHSEYTNRKLLEVKMILGGGNRDHLKVHEMREGSTMGCLHSVRSDLTRTRDLPELQDNVSMQSGQEALGTDKDPNRTPTSLREAAAPVCSLEGGVSGKRIKEYLNVADEMQSTQNKRSRKTGTVKAPILSPSSAQSVLLSEVEVTGADRLVVQAN